MSKKRRRQVVFNEEVTVVTPITYSTEVADDAEISEPKHPKLDFTPDPSGESENNTDEAVSLNAPKPSAFKPGSRLRDQLESDSEPEDDMELYLDAEKKGYKKKKKRTESDKEVSTEKEGLDEEDLFAQEEATLRFDGDIKVGVEQVTPFNVDEEMEEGRFDAEGNYYTFREEDVQDNWLTEIDWSNVDEQGEMLLEQKRRGPKARDDWRKFLIKKEKLKSSNEAAVKQGTELTKNECISRILSILTPKETVSQALNRLKPLNPREKTTTTTLVGDKTDTFLELTELADLMCFHGEYDVYSASFEKLQTSLKSVSTPPPPPASSDCEAEDTHSEVSWEYKTDEKETTKLYGPFKSSQMLAWSKAGYFGRGVLVRRVDKKEGQFYDSKRIDFDLYI